MLADASVRPPVDEIVAFLRHLIEQNGSDFLAKLFGDKAVQALAPRGGIEKVAIALSESKTVEDFGDVLNLLTTDVEHMRNVLAAVEEGNLELLRSMNIKESAIGDVKFFLDKLVETGFLNRT
ncbi:PREDICTED: IDLSRF-like peptide [Priapulus caudatus]|uniref:IDLSRF-like peptide n=1 Tax=Priapulus caudatus TaxID=37621 RepID=A0ABM1EC50_PRICU|nr:PREDICTED: IDLSRF-like peptide [Priapulus caudatus]